MSSNDDIARDLLRRDTLGYEVTSDIMRYLLSGRCSDKMGALILNKLADCNMDESDILGMLDVMQKHMIPVELFPGAIDMCGTGGDGMRTFNVSTAASFVVAAAGGQVAKHGNRSSSGGTGSADIFEMLGYDIEDSDPATAFVIHDICFMFARRYHPAARHVAGARKIVGRPTVFNLLGPLCNPAGVKRQLVGVSDPKMLHMIPRLLRQRGSERVMTVMSQNGIDEISAETPSHMVLYTENGTIEDTINPASLGIKDCYDADMRVNDEMEAFMAFIEAVSGKANHTMVQTTALNAAAGLVVAGMCDTISEGYNIASHTISSGKSRRLLAYFIKEAGDIGIVEEFM